MLAETLALAHPIIPFVTEEIWSHMPGADGLLMAHAVAGAGRPALRDEDAEAEVTRAIAATQELRGWRDRVGAAAGKLVPARLEAGGYDRTAAHVARLARVEWSADGGEPVATVGVPGGSVAVLASETLDLEAAARRAERPAGDAREGDRARRGQARQPGLHGQGAGCGRRGRAREARRACKRELEEL